MLHVYNRWRISMENWSIIGMIWGLVILIVALYFDHTLII